MLGPKIYLQIKAVQTYGLRSFSSNRKVLIETHELEHMINHDHGNLAIFNATLKRGDIDPIKDHVKSRIKHSILFDFEQFCQKGTELPYMLPSEEQFCELMKTLDVRKSDHIVVYD